jgi:cation diffusion facilitator CzcD-associated flavoprotein CzcO
MGTEGEQTAREHDVVVVGAGFAGLYMLYRLRELGLRARVIERGRDVGGTWYWNRYPGARCDIESFDYQYSFSDELLEDWVWSERYAAQPEILAYLNHVADRFDLRSDIDFGTSVRTISWVEEEARWTVVTDAGSYSARFCVMAVGNLSSIKRPDFEGLDDFEGEWYHTGRWPEGGVDFSAKRVGIIGTGSTGIQAMPIIAEAGAEVLVFQRTPNYSMPARNRPIGEDERREVLASFKERRRLCEESEAGTPLPPATTATTEASEEEIRERYEAGWQRGGISALSYAFTDFFTSEEANRTAQDFARAKIREIVEDPAVAEALSPAHHIGTKRTAVDTNYFQSYNRSNVHLVDLRTEPIERLTPRGIKTTAQEYPLDVIVFAIGFDAMTGALLEIEVRGRADRTLGDAWRAGPVTYLGLSVPGFPNLFMITGPGSPSVLSNMVVSIEQHVEFIAALIEHMDQEQLAVVDASEDAAGAWVAHVNELADETLYPQASSWYLGANIPGKPRVFMPYVGGCGRYRQECDDVVADGYRGFCFDAASDQVSQEVSA